MSRETYMPCTGIYDSLVARVTQNHHYVKQGVLHSKGATGGAYRHRRPSPPVAALRRPSPPVAARRRPSPPPANVRAPALTSATGGQYMTLLNPKQTERPSSCNNLNTIDHRIDI